MLHEFMSASPPKYQAKPGRSLSPERAKPATSPQPTPSLQVQPFSTENFAQWKASLSAGSGVSIRSVRRSNSR